MLSVLESKRALAIYLAAGAAFAALSARGLLVPLYAHDIGASRFEVGALFSVGTLAGALLSLPSGLLIDRFGASKLLWTSIIVSAMSQLATAATTSVALLFLWQITGGLAAGAQQASLYSSVTESVPPNRLGRSMGWLTFSMQAGFFLGPTIGGLLIAALPQSRTVIAITTVVLIFAVPGAIASPATRQAEGRFELMTPLRSLFAQKAFVPVTIGLVAATLVWGTTGAYLPIFGREALGLPSAQVGFLLALQAVANGVSRIPGGRIVDWAPHRWPIVFIGTVVFALATIVLGHLQGFVLPAIVLVGATPFLAIAFVTCGVVFGNLSGASTRGVTMGVYGTVLFLALAVGPLLVGPIVQTNGYAAGFTVIAAISIALALVMAAMHAEPLRRRAEVPLPPASPGT